MIHKATDGKGTWYGSLDGELWVHFPVKPMPGDEKYIRANLEPEDASTLAARLARKRPAPVTRHDLAQRGFTFDPVKK